MKQFLLNSWLGFDLIQMKWFRKWYGGEWTKVLILERPDIAVWVKGSPEPFLKNHVRAVQIEKY